MPGSTAPAGPNGNMPNGNGNGNGRFRLVLRARRVHVPRPPPAPSASATTPAPAPSNVGADVHMEPYVPAGVVNNHATFGFLASSATDVDALGDGIRAAHIAVDHEDTNVNDNAAAAAVAAVTQRATPSELRPGADAMATWALAQWDISDGPLPDTDSSDATGDGTGAANPAITNNDNDTSSNPLPTLLARLQVMHGQFDVLCGRFTRHRLSAAAATGTATNTPIPIPNPNTNPTPPAPLETRAAALTAALATFSINLRGVAYTLSHMQAGDPRIAEAGTAAMALDVRFRALQAELDDLIHTHGAAADVLDYVRRGSAVQRELLLFRRRFGAHPLGQAAGGASVGALPLPLSPWTTARHARLAGKLAAEQAELASKLNTQMSSLRSTSAALARGAHVPAHVLAALPGSVASFEAFLAHMQRSWEALGRMWAAMVALATADAAQLTAFMETLDQELAALAIKAERSNAGWLDGDSIPFADDGERVTDDAFDNAMHGVAEEMGRVLCILDHGESDAAADAARRPVRAIKIALDDLADRLHGTLLYRARARQRAAARAVTRARFPTAVLGTYDDSDDDSEDEDEDAGRVTRAMYRSTALPPPPPAPIFLPAPAPAPPPLRSAVRTLHAQFNLLQARIRAHATAVRQTPHADSMGTLTRLSRFNVAFDEFAHKIVPAMKLLEANPLRLPRAGEAEAEAEAWVPEVDAPRTGKLHVLRGLERDLRLIALWFHAIVPKHVPIRERVRLSGRLGAMIAEVEGLAARVPGTATEATALCTAIHTTLDLLHTARDRCLLPGAVPDTAELAYLHTEVQCLETRLEDLLDPATLPLPALDARFRAAHSGLHSLMARAEGIPVLTAFCARHRAEMGQVLARGIGGLDILSAAEERQHYIEHTRGPPPPPGSSVDHMIPAVAAFLPRLERAHEQLRSVLAQADAATEAERTQRTAGGVQDPDTESQGQHPDTEELFWALVKRFNALQARVQATTARTLPSPHWTDLAAGVSIFAIKYFDTCSRALNLFLQHGDYLGGLELEVDDLARSLAQLERAYTALADPATLALGDLNTRVTSAVAAVAAIGSHPLWPAVVAADPRAEGVLAHLPATSAYMQDILDAPAAAGIGGYISDSDKRMVCHWVLCLEASEGRWRGIIVARKAYLDGRPLPEGGDVDALSTPARDMDIDNPPDTSDTPAPALPALADLKRRFTATSREIANDHYPPAFPPHVRDRAAGIFAELAEMVYDTRTVLLFVENGLLPQSSLWIVLRSVEGLDVQLARVRGILRGAGGGVGWFGDELDEGGEQDEREEQDEGEEGDEEAGDDGPSDSSDDTASASDSGDSNSNSNSGDSNSNSDSGDSNSGDSNSGDSSGDSDSSAYSAPSDSYSPSDDASSDDADALAHPSEASRALDLLSDRFYAALGEHETLLERRGRALRNIDSELERQAGWVDEVLMYCADAVPRRISASDRRWVLSVLGALEERVGRLRRVVHRVELQRELEDEVDEADDETVRMDIDAPGTPAGIASSAPFTPAGIASSAPSTPTPTPTPTAPTAATTLTHLAAHIHTQQTRARTYPAPIAAEARGAYAPLRETADSTREYLALLTAPTAMPTPTTLAALERTLSALESRVGRFGSLFAERMRNWREGVVLGVVEGDVEGEAEAEAEADPEAEAEAETEDQQVERETAQQRQTTHRQRLEAAWGRRAVSAPDAPANATVLDIIALETHHTAARGQYEQINAWFGQHPAAGILAPPAVSPTVTALPNAMQIDVDIDVDTPAPPASPITPRRVPSGPARTPPAPRSPRAPGPPGASGSHPRPTGLTLDAATYAADMLLREVRSVGRRVEDERALVERVRRERELVRDE